MIKTLEPHNVTGQDVWKILVLGHLEYVPVTPVKLKYKIATKKKEVGLDGLIEPNVC